MLTRPRTSAILASMKRRLEEVLNEFYAEGIPDDVKERPFEYVEKLRDASVVMGMRRTGKTYMTYQRMRGLVADGIPLERIVHVNFDDERLNGLKVEDLRLIGDIHAEKFPAAAREKCWYFLDELQNVEGWELYARRLVDSPLVQLWLTGSSSRLLSSEIATHMRGRSFETEVFPLSFGEFLRFNGILKPEDRIHYTSRFVGLMKSAMARYLEEGGFPDVQGLGPRARNRLLQEYADAVVYRDVLERHEVPSVQSLKYTLDHVVHNYARKTSTRAISGVLKNLGMSSNREFIADYLDYLADAYLLYRVSIRTDSLAVRRSNPDKYYIVDTGLVRAMTPKIEAERGWLLENLVFMHLRRGFNKIEYYNTRKGDEVDFFVTDRTTSRRRLLQVTWEMSARSTEDRELTALRDAREETGIDDCTVVTWEEDRVLDDGIRVLPAWKWCLEGT